MKILLNDVDPWAAVKVIDLPKTIVDNVYDASILMTRNGVDISEIPLDRVMMNEFKYAVDDLLNDDKAEKWWLRDGKKRLDLQVNNKDGDVAYELGYKSWE